MSRPVFADPKTAFVLDEAHRVVDVRFGPPGQRPKVSGLWYSIVDVKCKDARGVPYRVEMQGLKGG